MVKSERIEFEDENDEDGSDADSNGAPVQGYFESSVPKAITLGGPEPTEHSLGNGDWVDNARLPPELKKPAHAGKDTLVLHRTPWLHRLAVTSRHRAHYVFSVEDLEKIHRVVYRKAAKNFLAEEGLAKMT